MSNLISCAIENAKPTARKNAWAKYYLPLLDKFDAMALVAFSDSDPIPKEEYEVPIWEGAPLKRDALNIHAAYLRLPARVDGNSYPRHWHYLWRALRLAWDLKADRLFTIESDSWVLTQRVINRMMNCKAGIGCPWCLIHGMPETMLAAYSREAFKPMIGFIESKTWQEWAEPQPLCLERKLPEIFTHEIWGDIIGDRYCEYLPEDPRHVVPPSADFVIQGEGTSPVWRG